MHTYICHIKTSQKVSASIFMMAKLTTTYIVLRINNISLDSMAITFACQYFNPGACPTADRGCTWFTESFFIKVCACACVCVPTRDGPIPLFTDISDTSICTEIICRYQYRYQYYTLKPRQVYYRNFIVVIHS